MAYIKKDWVGSRNPLEADPGSTPITEEALDHLETQYDEAVAYTDEAVEGVVAQVAEVAQGVSDVANVVNTGRLSEQALNATVGAEVAVQTPGIVVGTPNAAPHTFAAIGDSITAYEPTLTAGYAMLGPAMAGDVLHDWARFATGGFTLQQINDTHLPSALNWGAKYILVAGGTNDVTQSTFDPAVAGALLASMCERIVAAGRVPILWAPPPRITRRAETMKLVTVARELASRNGWEILDAWRLLLDPATGELNTAYDSGDGLHPNRAGHVVLARELAVILRRLMPGPTRGWLDSALYDPALNAATGLMPDSNSDGRSNGFVAAYGTVGTSTVPGAPRGAWQAVTVASGVTTDGAIVADVAGAIPGHTYEIRYVAEANLAAAGPTFLLGSNLSWRSATANIEAISTPQKPQLGNLGGLTSADRLYYKTRSVCPPGADRVRHSLFTGTPTVAPAVDAYLRVAQFSVRDLTALGLA